MEFRFGIGAVRVNVTGQAALLSEVADRFRRDEGFALATLNLDHLVKLRRDRGFFEAYVRHELITADGNPVVWLSRLAGREVALLPGADLIVPLAREAVQQDVALAFIGGTTESLARAAKALQQLVPGLRVAARIAPTMGFDPNGAEAKAALDAVAESGAGLVFLALGAPKQERLAARGRDLHPGMGFVSIGAGLDFLAGSQRRAPRLMRRLALEWLWRAGSDPARLAGRYVRCAAILPGHALRAWRMRHD